MKVRRTDLFPYIKNKTDQPGKLVAIADALGFFGLGGQFVGEDYFGRLLYYQATLRGKRPAMVEQIQKLEEFYEDQPPINNPPRLIGYLLRYGRDMGLDNIQIERQTGLCLANFKNGKTTRFPEIVPEKISLPALTNVLVLDNLFLGRCDMLFKLAEIEKEIHPDFETLQNAINNG
jgi:hypothetical protein